MPAAPSRRWRSAADRSSRWSVELTDHSLSTAGTVRDADGNEQRLRSRREPARVHDVVCTPFSEPTRCAVAQCCTSARLCCGCAQSNQRCSCVFSASCLEPCLPACLPACLPGWGCSRQPVSATSRCKVSFCVPAALRGSRCTPLPHMRVCACSCATVCG